MNRDSQRLRLALVVLLLISFTLITLDYRSSKGGAFNGVRTVANAIFGPIERGVSAVVTPIGDFFSDLAHAGSNGRKVRSLQEQVDRLQAQLRGNGDVIRDKAELDKLVTLAAANQYNVLSARVVAIGDLSGFDAAATLNVGSRDGVKVDMTVINGAGLVGRIVSVAPFSSTIALAVDPNVKVGSRVQGNAEVGITSGHGMSSSLTFAPQDPSVRPKVGDIIQTFGTLTYAADVPIGTVTSISPTPGKTTVTAEVKPFVDYTALNVVGVVVPTERTTTAQPTLPPPPTTPPPTTPPPSTPPPSGTTGTGTTSGTTTAPRASTQSTPR